MTFAATLKGFLDSLGCNAKDLAEASNVSAPSISRYLSGERTPALNGDVVQKLAAGIASLAKREGQLDVDEQAIARDLACSLAGPEIDYDAFVLNFRTLMTALGINGNRLARALGFDPSYISRIQSGQRRPANLARFIDGVAVYVARNCTGEDVTNILELCGDEGLDSGNRSSIAQAIRAYLGSNSPVHQEPHELERFLKKLDEFDLNDYLQSVRFDEIRVPTAPFQLPTTKTYRGIEQMKQAELDFLKAAVLSKRNDDVILYSDMPMEDMAKDKDFAKKVMLGMGMLIKKGVRLLNIHDVHRPVRELIMGLEGWLPLYMTGQIVGYYFEQPTNQAFLHFIRSAGSVAAYGEAIAGNQPDGRYVVSKSVSEVEYQRARAQALLAHAKPLIRTFFEHDEDLLAAELEACRAAAGEEPHTIAAGVFKNTTLSVLPHQYALVTKDNGPRTHMLIEHPALVNAFAQYTPTLY